MIRHKEGGFVYSFSDIEIMSKDIESVKRAGATGVVLGCLTPDLEINIEQSEELFLKAKSIGLEVTFHRAFDFCLDPQIALEN